MENKKTQQNISSEWKTLTFKDLGISVIDGDRGVNYPNHNDFLNQGHCLFLNAGNVTKNGFKFSEVSFITEQKDKEMGKGKLTKDDLVITTRGTIGNIAHYSNQIQYENIRINSGMAIMRNSKENVRINTNFLLQYFNSSLFSKELKRVSFGSAQPQLTIQIINKFVVKTPEDKFEQKRIVAVLGTWDQAIEKLKRKIEVKKEIKKGLMQELLTGKTRLNGFRSSWSNYELEQLLKPASEKYNPLTDQKSRKCIELEHLQKNDPELLGYVDSSNQKSIKSVFRKGDVLFGKLRPYLKKYLFAEFDGVCSTEIWVLKATQKIHSIYMYYLIQTARFVSIANVSSGTHMPRADWDYMKNISFSVPDDLEEQKAIANILRASDSEIRILVKKLNIFKDQKRYLLNNLITGTIRTPETLSIPK